MKKEWKRFLSILLITALGVGMMTGLYAAGQDMYYSADQFFDRQNLFDIRILSTLGLTAEDVSVLAGVEGVEAAEGGYIETVHTEINGVSKSADMTVLSRSGINAPQLLVGALPTRADELAVTQKYLDESGNSVGATLTIIEDLEEKESEEPAPEKQEQTQEEPETDQGEFSTDVDFDMNMETELEEEAEAPTFANTTYTITGVVSDPKDIRGDEDTGSAFRSTVTADYSFFITEEAANSDVFTVVYLILSGTKGLNSFSDAYESRVQAAVRQIEGRIKLQREQARYDAVMSEAQEKIADAENTVNEKLAEADQKFGDAWREVDEARQELADGQATLMDEERDAKKQIADARKKLEDAKQELADAEAELTKGEVELAEAEAELHDGEQELADGEKKLLESEQELADGKQELLDAEQELADGEQELLDGEQELADGKEELTKGDEQLSSGELQLAQGEAELDANAQALAAGRAQLGAAQAQLNSARGQLEPAIEQLQTTFGAAWPASEWDALVSAVAVLAANGVGDDKILAETDQGKALNEVIQGRVVAMKDDLSQQISQMQAALEGLNQAILLLDQQLTTATGEESTQLMAERDARVQDAAGLTAALAQMNAQMAQMDALPGSTVAAAVGMGKVVGGQLALDAAEAELSAGEAQIVQARNTIEAKKLELEAGKAALVNGWMEWKDGRAKLDEGWTEWEDGKAKLAEGWTEWEDGRTKLAEGWAEWEDGKAELADGWAEWEDGKAELAKGRAEWEDGKIELADGEAELKKEEADAKVKIGDAWEEIADGKQELADGEAELGEQEQEYAEKKEEARQKISDAYAELDDIDMTRWYVQDRTSLDSYSSLNSDLSSIEAVGKLFPILFLLVALLMSLTTMTRMVEEERSLIGTYKALGFGNGTIYQKYMLFAFMACLLGGILGDVFGFVFMPKFVEVILSSLYSLPQYYLRFDTLYGVGSVVLFMAAIVGATLLSCGNELRQMPAALLRPKAPRSGSRVWLERIPAVWNRMKFLNKVTVRNLFRYKKRLFMTVGGIMGCTALIVCGFAIRDSVMKLSPNQYEAIYQYDLMAVFEEEDHDTMARLLEEDGNVADHLDLRMESVKLFNASGASSSVQLMVIPEGSSLADYIRLEDLDGALTQLEDGGVLITENATRVLDLKTGDTVSLQNLDLVQKDATISGIVKNYLGNNVYMTQALYESLFGTYEPNGILAHLSEACTDQAAYAEGLLEYDSVLSAVSTDDLGDGFQFDLLNSIVVLLIVLAGGLALVVLFTLSTTNISERARELATIKVLGFYDQEVHQYVNKETIILTAIGVLVGLPAGRLLSIMLMAALNMPSIQFVVYIQPLSYLLSAAITFFFAIVVNWMTNRTLNRINMVEALKSVE